MDELESGVEWKNLTPRRCDHNPTAPRAQNTDHIFVVSKKTLNYQNHITNSWWKYFCQINTCHPHWSVGPTFCPARWPAQQSICFLASQDALEVIVWVSEWIDEWVSECMNEWLDGWVSEWLDEWVTGWMSEWVGGWVSERMVEWVSGWMSEWMDRWVSEWMYERVNGWMCEWVDGWVSEWMIERVSG